MVNNYAKKQLHIFSQKRMGFIYVLDSMVHRSYVNVMLRIYNLFNYDVFRNVCMLTSWNIYYCTNIYLMIIKYILCCLHIIPSILLRRFIKTMLYTKLISTCLSPLCHDCFILGNKNNVSSEPCCYYHSFALLGLKMGLVITTGVPISYRHF